MKGYVQADHLYCTAKEVDTNLRKQLVHSMLQEGMHHPIIVLSTTAKEWRSGYWADEAFEQCPEHLDNTDDVLLILCGNNRYRVITEDFGYNRVFCHIVYSLEEGSRLCKQQRREWDARSRGPSETRQDAQSQCKTCQK